MIGRWFVLWTYALLEDNPYTSYATVMRKR